MTGRLRVGIVGAGYFARFHYDAWSRLDDAAIVALADPDRPRAEATARDFAVPATFETAEALLDGAAPDLLDIVTPPETHAEIVALAAARGVPVVCQKPLAPGLAEARAIVAAAATAGIPLIVHENFRFQPWYRHARRLLDDGRLGAPHAISFRLRPGDGQGPRAYLDRQPYFQTMPRFLIHETGIHFIDVFRFLFGEIAAVSARLRRINPAVAGEDAGYVVFEFASGAGGLFDGNRLNDHSARNCRLTMGEMHIEGSEAVLRLDGEGGLWLKPHGAKERAEPYAWAERGFAGDCVYALNAHVAAHLRHGAPVENAGSVYLRNIEIEEAIYDSSASGRRIAIDAADSL